MATWDVKIIQNPNNTFSVRKGMSGGLVASQSTSPNQHSNRNDAVIEVSDFIGKRLGDDFKLGEARTPLPTGDDALDSIIADNMILT